MLSLVARPHLHQLFFLSLDSNIAASVRIILVSFFHERFASQRWQFKLFIPSALLNEYLAKFVSSVRYVGFWSSAEL